MSDLVQFEPYDFRGDVTAHTFKQFLKYCADFGASDILVQGGDYAWIEIHGRQRQASTHTIKQGHLSNLIGTVWQAEVENNVRAGHGADRSLELAGEELGIDRGKFLRFRCNFIQGRVARYDMAYAVTMRLIPFDLPDITKMGIEQELFEAFYPGMGLVLVCGPTGSGKTTLQSAVYGYAGIHMPDRKVITYEDPIEFVLGGPHWKGPQPHQAQIGRDIESFATGLRNAMRRKPSIIGIGEMRDLETIDAAIEAGLTGHLTYGTMHTESCAETINRAIQVYPPQQQSAVASRLLGCLRVIVVQRLLKTTDGKRVAVREFVVFDREFKNELQSQPYDQWAPMIRARLESEKTTLDDKAWSLYQESRIDKSEFIEMAGHKSFRIRSQEAA
ncbi:plasmid transfer ATPase TraJ (plasmid) [Xanthomonas campestris pv. olitorii]|uniref:plasmid transfer ATPase TraJ n=1 Tax=Xanthomonas TaxID=338 RepID=UPI0009385335|nr:plasmid transfer ATPase TraJ [Xanthomonas euvesicatoria]WVK06422.1 plasmid transfer ATPase TraJ [Xanthomonas campestris pv. olitorii]APO88908.1 plasmid transfer ATPase TraJ [Xanthomonas euvesicatoria]MCC8518283.1 plasmid transfer ATPase TraJ [Xanthomonas euvesicatoria pv. euvesicatoria]MCC8545940.1 plasmid transfer ATPase TraJ [Xanthomonas euvesicatoria pv. euvesicatoria]MCC8613238.1 plasmid transfer ATPase TraJ [Xanthomonas euvesicatoria pv. euvesicatoria]